MTNKNKSKSTFPLPFHLPSLSFTLDFSATFAQVMQGTGDGSCDLFIMLFLCHSFLLMLFPPMGGSPSRTSQTWVLLKFFKNCSSVCPFHKIQSFRNRLLQGGCRAKFLPALAWALHGVTTSFAAHSPAST